MVTGKNKEQFKIFYETITGGNYKIPYQNFMAYPFEMQIGVYLAYYDSLSIFIDSDLSYDLVDEELSDEWESGFWYKKDYSINKGYFNSRNEAYKEAFKQADKLMNK
tara:strand:+ start:2309 stop:2629 length:321 start_codon:yes stop_codon:yes gene_type:complete